MPMDRSKYPDDWDFISYRVVLRAKDRCQKCGLKNGVRIRRFKKHKTHWLYEHEAAALSVECQEKLCKPITVVLTVHHIGVEKPDGSPGDPDDKMDCRRENLIALCQRCHLLADMDTHIRNRRRNRIAKQRQAGQIDLFQE